MKSEKRKVKSEERRVKSEKWKVKSSQRSVEWRITNYECFLFVIPNASSLSFRTQWGISWGKGKRFFADALNDKGSEKWETNSEKWRELLRYWVVVGGGWAHSHFGTPRRGEPLCSPVMTLIWTSPQPPFKGGMQIWRLTAVRALKGRVNSAQCAALGK